MTAARMSITASRDPPDLGAHIGQHHSGKRAWYQGGEIKDFKVSRARIASVHLSITIRITQCCSGDIIVTIPCSGPFVDELFSAVTFLDRPVCGHHFMAIFRQYRVESSSHIALG